ncbi:hypothetical protein M1349_05065 [Patescibacteria group bacterium]|nr:hypothetical protein [Patescibacteria group bacterium]
MLFILVVLPIQTTNKKTTVFENKASLADGGQPYRGSGHDVSWPQCDIVEKLPKADFGIVGVTGGKAFTGNPCLSEEYKWALATGSASVYINVHVGGDDDPDRSLKGPYGNCHDADLDCQFGNYGYNSALHAFSYAKSQGVEGPRMWWLDVEELNYWTDDPTHNRRIIDGAVKFFNEKGLPVGVYSTPLMWRDLTGDYQNGLPVWPAIISDTPAENCGKGFTGGETFLVQHDQIDLDKNLGCK